MQQEKCFRWKPPNQVLAFLNLRFFHSLASHATHYGSFIAGTISAVAGCYYFAEKGIVFYRLFVFKFSSPRTCKNYFHIIWIFEHFDWFMFPFEKYFHERGASENSFFSESSFLCFFFIIFFVLLRFNLCFFHVKTTTNLANWQIVSFTT